MFSAHMCARICVRAHAQPIKKQWKYSDKIEKHIYFSETLKIMEKIVYGRSRVAEERSSKYTRVKIRSTTPVSNITVRKLC